MSTCMLMQIFYIKSQFVNSIFLYNYIEKYQTFLLDSVILALIKFSMVLK